jgi:hypothetical protein
MPEAAAAYVADYFAFEVIGTTVAEAAFIQTAVQVVATVALNQLASSVLGSSGKGGTTSTQALNTTIRQSAAARRLIYGTVKAGGVLVYPAQSDDGKYAYLAVYIGEGPIDGIDSTFWVGDELSTESKFSGLLNLEAYTGASGQTASATLIAASSGEWTATEIGTGCAYAVVRYEFDRNAFPHGLVFPAFLVRGRLIYDPRTLTSTFSANPALCLLDYIRSEYGYAAPDDWIDFDSFGDAASICDEVIDSLDPANVVDSVTGKVLRYTLNGVFETTTGPAAVVATMEAAMGGKLVFVGGKYRCYAGAYRAPTGPTLTGEYLRDDPVLRTHPGRQQRINTARGTYREARQDWQTIDYQEQVLSAAVVSDDGEIVQNIDYPCTVNGATAQRLARIAMRHARSSVPLTVRCNLAAFQWQLYDTITVNLPDISASGTYLITSYTFAQGGGIDMVLVPHLAADFEWSTANEVLVPDLVIPNFNRTPPPVLGLVVTGGQLNSDDQPVPILFATWTATVFAQIKHYEIQYKLSSDSAWSNSSTATTESWSSPVSSGFEYDFRVRIVGQNDTYGSWASEVNIQVNADQTPPGVPTGLNVTHQGVGVHNDRIEWTTPTDLDFSRSRVYVNTINDSSTATEIAEIFGLPGTAYETIYSHDDVDDHYYWVESVDRVGNVSARTYAGGV